MAHTLVSDPTAFLRDVATWHKLFFLLLLLVPWLGLWAFEPLLLLGAIPDLAVNLLSSQPEQTTIQFQYTAGIVPFVVAASIFGASRLRREKDQLTFYVLAGAACIALFSPVYFAAKDLPQALPSNPVHAAKAHALDLIPGGVPVAASNELAGYLSDRRFVYLFPYIRNARWAVFDVHDGTIVDQKGYHRTIHEIDTDPAWHLVYSSRGIQVLRKRSQPAKGS